jgi:uncharacterized metal-binding protein
MPSGRIHDSITLWSLPLVAALTFERTRSSNLTLMVSGGFLFGGLMFGPDLDVYSRQYLRWGPLRWIWLPYRQNMRHRSFLSHGPIVGTVVRVVYLLLWLGILGLAVILIGSIASQMIGAVDNGQILAQNLLGGSAGFLSRSLQQNAAEWISLGIGIELGALSHSLSDWVGSAYKRLKKSRLKSISLSNYSPSDSLEDVSEEYSQNEPVEWVDRLPPSIQQAPKPEQDGQASNRSPSSVPPHLKRIPRLPPFGK